MPTLGQALQSAVATLGTSPTARLDAEVLLAHTLQSSRVHVLARSDEPLAPDAALRFGTLVERRAAGEPVAYLVGRAWFYGLELVVSSDVLVPRPETEALVEWALGWVRARRRDRDGGQGHGHRRPLVVVDVGTGSGAVAVALATQLAPADAEIVATDVSPAALRIATGNAARLGVADRIRFALADLLPAAPERFDLVVANLPYVGLRELGDVDLDVLRWEPHVALFAGPDGLDIIRRLLVDLAPTRLARGGAVALEIGWRQGQAVVDLARAALPGAEVDLRRDFAGLDRMVVVQLPG